MASKSQPNGSDLRRSWPPQQGPRLLTDLNQKLGAKPNPGTGEKTEYRSEIEDHPLYPPAVREMLESHDYQVALVARSEWDCLGRSDASTPSILLAFSWEELVARVSEFAHDSTRVAERKTVQFADVRVDLVRIEVSRLSGEKIALTKQEFKTLKCFLSNPERVFSRDELLAEAWGYQNYPSTRTVDNHVLKLRQKLERDPARPVHFQTVHGVGYKFVP